MTTDFSLFWKQVAKQIARRLRVVPIKTCEIAQRLTVVDLGPLQYLTWSFF